MAFRLFGAVTLGFAAAAHHRTAHALSPSVALSPSEFRSFPLASAYDESHNTKVFRFAYPEGDMTSGMTCSSCVLLHCKDAEGNDVVRPYTPISRVNQPGYLEILVKKYEGSKMGSYLHSLKRGDTVEIKGPIVKLPIKPRQFSTIGMIAGGTGIAPMYQVIQEVLNEPSNNTEVRLVYASRKKEDVLLGNELNKLMELFPTKFNVYYVLSQPPPSWLGGMGHINADMLKAFMPPPTQADSVVLVCGPPPFMETISGEKDYVSKPPSQGELKGLLKELGYNANQVFKY